MHQISKKKTAILIRKTGKKVQGTWHKHLVNISVSGKIQAGYDN